MNFKKSAFILSLLFSFSMLQAQKFELGKVSIAELQEKVHPKDTAAVAAVLFEIGRNFFEYNQTSGFSMVREVKTRIKIYKKEGFNDWANRKIRYYLDGNSKESVTISDALTYNLVDGKIEKTKLKSDGEFDETINKYWGQKKIAFPNVKEGSVIEYQYVTRSHRVGSPKDWYFQTSIPINYSEYKTIVPEYFIYNSNLRGFIAPKVTVEKSLKQVNVLTKEKEGGSMYYQPKTTVSYDKFEYLETRTTYLAENMPAMKEEAYVNNVDNYSTSLVQELSMIKYPDKPLEAFSTDWKSVVKTIYDFDDFGQELEKTGYFEDDLKGVIAGLTTPEEKIDALLKYVKATVKWDGYYRYYCSDGVKQAYKNKIGNSAEINLMLTAMLRYAGLTANPVLLSTRSNGIAIFPNLNAFNYIISAVETPTGMTLLDAADEFSTPNILPFRDLNWVGRLIRKDGTSEEVDLMPKTASVVSVSMNYSVDANGEVSGKLRRQSAGHKAMLFRQDVKDMKEDAYLEKLENDNKKIEINEYTRTNEKDLKLPVIENLSFKGANFSELIGGKIYIKPMLSFGDEQNPFKQETREYPVDYGFPFVEKHMINIQIPEGYKVESMPATTTLSMIENLGSFKFIINSTGNSIQMSVTSQINTAIISSEYYAVLKDYYQKIVEKQNEKIVLVKI